MKARLLAETELHRSKNNKRAGKNPRPFIILTCLLGHGNQSRAYTKLKGGLTTVGYQYQHCDGSDGSTAHKIQKPTHIAARNGNEKAYDQRRK